MSIIQDPSPAHRLRGIKNCPPTEVTRRQLTRPFPQEAFLAFIRSCGYLLANLGQGGMKAHVRGKLGRAARVNMSSQLVPLRKVDPAHKPGDPPGPLVWRYIWHDGERMRMREPTRLETIRSKVRAHKFSEFQRAQGMQSYKRERWEARRAP